MPGVYRASSLCLSPVGDLPTLQVDVWTYQVGLEPIAFFNGGWNNSTDFEVKITQMKPMKYKAI